MLVELGTSALGLGLVLGARHALEPDHLAAVTTLAAERRGPWAGLALGSWWGLGHALSLGVVAGTLAALGLEMPASVATWLETAVGVMVVLLGLRAVWLSLREGREGASAWHAHGGSRHRHPAKGEHLHLSRWTLATRPLLVGLAHGLAGSGALTALVLAELPGTQARLGYVLAFGLGSVGGMAALSGLAGAPLHWLRRVPQVGAALLCVAGLVSVTVGALWVAAGVAQL
ncbi:MAG: hypothetical protein K1X89_19485 [Myxococcaceae bacterium]|nr:hypothetical protein [Myxococcaceae bacterium]